MKRVLNIVAKNEELAAEIKITAKGDGSCYKSAELNEQIHRFFDGIVVKISEHFYYNEIKIKSR